MNKMKIIITLALVLLVGIFAGALGTRIYLKHQMEESQAGRSRSSEEKVKKIMKRLTRDLRLDAGQQAEIEKILVVTDARATGVRTLYQPDLKRIYDQGFELIEQKLNDEQKARLVSRREKSAARYSSYYFRSLRTAEEGLPDAEALKNRFVLDAAQQSRITVILEDQKNRRKLIIEKYEKVEKPDLAAARSELAEVSQAARARLAEVLTPEQMTRYDEER